MKYPIGIQTFERIRTEGYVYVDKTALVYKLVSEGSIYFLSRPRRFGKSLLVSTLHAYFEGRKELFKGLAIEHLEKDWLEYPVLHFDFNGKNFMAGEEALPQKIDFQLTQYEEIYHVDPKNLAWEERFSTLIEKAYEKTGRKVVVLIDEYDKPILDVMDTPLEDVNRNILKAFYSTFKSADASLRFVLLTGVTKFSQVSVFSGFNQPEDISMSTAYDTLCGITEEELFTVFAESIREMAEKKRTTEEKIKEELKRRYDGYHFSEAMVDIYNPFSLLNAFKQKNFGDYWFASGTPAYLVKLLAHANINVKQLTEREYNADMFANYKADVQQPLPMIYQSGYLTIKEYDPLVESYKLDFPNNEVSRGFLTAIAAGYFKRKDEGEATGAARDMFAKLHYGEVDEFITYLKAFLASIPYDAHESLKDKKLTEQFFEYTFYLLLRLMGTYCQVFVEKRNSQGRADCVMEMQDYVYIFEFKLDGTADEALAQIEEKGYATPYLADKRKVRKLGVVFSSETRTISEWKEQ